MSAERILEQPLPFQPEVDLRPRDGGAKLVDAKPRSVRETKKSHILRLFAEGCHEVDRLALLSETTPAYAASVLQNAGLLGGYFDLYTSTAAEQNVYSRYFRGVIGFKTVEAARESVEKIERLYRHFERLGDRAGQHHAEVMALVGRNRARWSNKKEAAQVFMDWLVNH